LAQPRVQRVGQARHLELHVHVIRIILQYDNFHTSRVSRIANSLKKRRRESTPYGVANARKVSNLAALCVLSGADFAAFLSGPLVLRKRIGQRTNDAGH
jgi:hypothetical protein